MSNAEKMATEHPALPIHYPDAVHYVEQWLNENHLTDEEREGRYQWRIYDYYGGSAEGLKSRPWTGARVSEVSVAGPRGGGSYMQIDLPWSLAFCAQVERCILALVEGWNQGAEYVDEDGGYLSGNCTDEEFWRLNDFIEEMKK